MTAEASSALGAKLRALRKRKGVTLERLAQLAGVSKSYLSELEGGVSVRPSALKLAAIADALGVASSFFLEAGVHSAEERHFDEAFYRAYLQLDPTAKDQMRRILATFQHRGSVA